MNTTEDARGPRAKASATSQPGAATHKQWFEPLLARGVLPDGVVRAGIRARLGRQLRRLEREAGADPAAQVRRVAARLREQPIAIHAEAANRQHYEVPAAFFRAFLGPRMKYSACAWPEGITTLAQAEDAMLALTCERAGIRDGMEILDLGCGWGSLALYVAEHFPNCRILAVSNSSSQGEHIRSEATRRGLGSVEHLVGNIVDVDPGRTFDRIVSIEMFEHVRNYEQAFRRVRSWLKPDGRLFVHVFAHERHAYTFDAGPDDWMGRTFFTGGTMPAHDLFLAFDRDLEVEQRWRMEGTHYSRTLEAWLNAFDRQRAVIDPILVETYGRKAARAWRSNWRLFLIASSEAFGYDGGRQWGISHYLLAPARAGGGQPA